MKISTRTRYGIRAALELAENYNKGPLQLGTIAQRQDISVKYLEQIMAMLKSGNFIRSIRGPRGGYMLAKAPNQIKLSDVFDCLEGTVTTVECVKDKNYCARSVDCIAKQLWQQVHRAIRDVLQSVTLQDLLDKAKDNRSTDYQI
jgi:Rrf2 family cysteine metabolism transcriptional repressor